MIRCRNGIKALALSGLVLGLMAIGAGGAQAEVGAAWMVNGSNVTSTLLPTIQIKEVETGEKVLTKIAGISVEKKCTGYQLIGAKLETEGKVSSGAKVRFTGCVLILNGKVSAACEPHTGKEKGVLESNAGKGLLVLHKLANGTLDPIVRIEPVAGETFMTIETGEECAIGEKIPIIGKITLKDCQNELAVEKVTHLVEEGPLTEVWVISKTAEHKVTFDGSAIGELIGEHKGLKVSGLPG